MSQAILISNNEVINSLYEVNLRAYVGTNVTIKPDINSATELIKHSPNIDVLICFSDLGQDVAAWDNFKAMLAEHSLRVPVIMLGDSKEPLENALVVKNKYDIKALLQALAKILEITAKDMASRPVPKYFPIPLKLLSSLETSHCDIFYRNEKENFEYEYFKIVEKDQPLAGCLSRYLNEGVSHLFIDANERLRFINKASATVVSELDREDLTAEERVEITQQGMGIVAEEVFASDEISKEVAEVSKACIASISKVVKEVPKVKNLLAMLIENKADYCYKHSVLNTYIASQIIKNISWGSVEQQNKIAFAFFFHDIYLVPIYRKYNDALSEEDLLFRDDVTEEEKQTVLDHAKLAGNLVKTFPKCPMGADSIIMQHHGMINGQGFAVTYKDDISPLSKIMIIAEDISTNVLQNTGPKGKININKEAIVEHLSERYRNHTYKKIIDAFMVSKL